MSDEPIRTDIRHHLRSRFAHRPNTLYVEEMEVCAGRGRIDLALITDRLIGIEIKGPKDNLARLADQAAHYSKCFDLVILIAHESFEERALKIVPPWWGIIVLSDAHTTHAYRLARRPAINAAVDLKMVLRLLWREEIDQLFARFLKQSAPRRLAKNMLRDELLEHAPANLLKAASLEALRARATWRTAHTN